MFKKKKIYLDHAAATPLDQQVHKKMKKFFFSSYANASSLYRDGEDARNHIEDARKSIASVLQTTPDTIFFTSGGTESNNTAIFGVAKKYKNDGKHIISTGIEHASILKPLKHLEEQGFEVTYIPVDKEGNIYAQQVVDALREDTILVSIMQANNEIGTILPIQEIGKKILRCRKKNNTSFPLFHTDACQATNYLDVHTDSLHVDLLSMNAGKIYGPKGIGLLYKRRGVEIEPSFFGGDQEFGLRPGTEDTASIVGFAEAAKITQAMKEKEIKRIQILRDLFWEEIRKHINDAVLNGPDIASSHRLVNNLSVSFIGADAESIILYLDAQGIQVSSGSACSVQTDEPSHVLKACVLSKDRLDSCIRFSLGRSTTKKDILRVVKVLKKVIPQVRSMNKKSYA